MTKLRKLNRNKIACAVGGFSLAFKVVGIFGCVDNRLIMKKTIKTNLVFVDPSMAFGCNT